MFIHRYRTKKLHKVFAQLLGKIVFRLRLILTGTLIVFELKSYLTQNFFSLKELFTVIIIITGIQCI